MSVAICCAFDRWVTDFVSIFLNSYFYAYLRPLRHFHPHTLSGKSVCNAPARGKYFSDGRRGNGEKLSPRSVSPKKADGRISDCSEYGSGCGHCGREDVSQLLWPWDPRRWH